MIYVILANNQCAGHGYHLWRVHCYFIIDIPEIWAGGNVGNHHPVSMINTYIYILNCLKSHNYCCFYLFIPYFIDFIFALFQIYSFSV